MKCRLCCAPADDVFLDLGAAPLSNAYLSAAQCQRAEPYWPLRLHACPQCRLVQLQAFERADSVFSPDYAYFSSYSRSWLEHARSFVDRAVDQLALGPHSRVVEVASNDGYLLQYVRQHGIACAGIEPTASTAAAAREKGIETHEFFLGRQTAREFVARHGHADLVVANNVLAHVPDLRDFVDGLAALLAREGTLTIEFPHLLELVGGNQFDTVYHEHYSYFSLHAARRALDGAGLRVRAVESLPTHGGSLRLWVGHHDAAMGAADDPDSVVAHVAREQAAGIDTDAFYRGFQLRADSVKNAFLEFLLQQKRHHRRVGAYGAAAKGNTLLNYAGVKPDLLGWVVDASPHKRGLFLPGSRIPIVDESRIRQEQPDFIVILPWNLRDEIEAQLAYARAWGARFVVAVPQLEIW